MIYHIWLIDWYLWPNATILRIVLTWCTLTDSRFDHMHNAFINEGSTISLTVHMWSFSPFYLGLSCACLQVLFWCQNILIIMQNWVRWVKFKCFLFITPLPLVQQRLKNGDVITLRSTRLPHCMTTFKHYPCPNCLVEQAGWKNAQIKPTTLGQDSWVDIWITIRPNTNSIHGTDQCSCSHQQDEERL